MKNLSRFSCQLLNSNGQVTTGRIFARSVDHAIQQLNEAGYKYANLSPSTVPVHPEQKEGIF